MVFEDLAFWGQAPMALKLNPTPHAEIITRSVSEALQASAFLDRMTGKEFDYCQCGCKRAVKRTAAGGLKYFDKKCGGKIRQAKFRTVRSKRMEKPS